MIFGISTILPLILCLISPWKYDVVNANVYIEDINIIYVNGDYVDKDTLDLSIEYKPNGANTINFHADIIKDFPEDVLVHFSVSSRVFGKEIPTGISATINVCKDDAGKSFFDRVFKPLGIEDCPVKKGSSFTIENYQPDFSKMSFIVRGAHLSTEVEIYTEKEKILHAKTFING